MPLCSHQIWTPFVTGDACIKTSNNPKETNDFIEAVSKAWEETAKEAEFADVSLAQFKFKVKPSLDHRAKIASLERQLIDARYNRDLADVVRNEECRNLSRPRRSD